MTVSPYYFRGPVLALGLAKEEAIQNWRNMLGPKEVDVAKQEAPDRLVLTEACTTVPSCW